MGGVEGRAAHRLICSPAGAQAPHDDAGVGGLAVTTCGSLNHCEPQRGDRRTSYTSLRYTLHRRSIHRCPPSLKRRHSQDCGRSTGPKIERGTFCAWLAVNPTAGDVIPGSGGCRKVRWSLPGQGKRGGVRVIYFNRLDDGRVWLLFMYSKAVRADVERKMLQRLRETV